MEKQTKNILCTFVAKNKKPKISGIENTFFIKNANFFEFHQVEDVIVDSVGIPIEIIRECIVKKTTKIKSIRIISKSKKQLAFPFAITQLDQEKEYINPLMYANELKKGSNIIDIKGLDLVIDKNTTFNIGLLPSRTITVLILIEVTDQKTQ